MAPGGVQDFSHSRVPPVVLDVFENVHHDGRVENFAVRQVPGGAANQADVREARPKLGLESGIRLKCHKFPHLGKERIASLV